MFNLFDNLLKNWKKLNFVTRDHIESYAWITSLFGNLRVGWASSMDCQEYTCSMCIFAGSSAFLRRKEKRTIVRKQVDQAEKERADAGTSFRVENWPRRVVAIAFFFFLFCNNNHDIIGSVRDADPRRSFDFNRAICNILARFFWSWHCIAIRVTVFCIVNPFKVEISLQGGSDDRRLEISFLSYFVSIVHVQLIRIMYERTNERNIAIVNSANECTWFCIYIYIYITVSTRWG